MARSWQRRPRERHNQAWSVVAAGLLAATAAAGCGATGGSDSDDDGASATTEAFCATAREMSTLDERTDIDVEVSSDDTPEVAAEKLAAAEAAFEVAADEARLLLLRLERDAPNAIRDEVVVVGEFVRSFFDTLAAGADGQQVDPPDLDLDRVEQAGKRVSDYVMAECGVELDPIGADLSVPPAPDLPASSVPLAPIPAPPSRP